MCVHKIRRPPPFQSIKKICLLKSSAQEKENTGIGGKNLYFFSDDGCQNFNYSVILMCN